ncbi:MAG: hypothetical protein J07AB43_14170 [Candidatus Nanosalina sp. J07AB43]|nr:MAG: hypothetical protein J07AB43_14170 [Candidatus Nanosalina sp. J07AB43]
MSSQDDVSEEDEKDVIEWSKELEDRTLAVLEGDLEENPETDLDRDELDGREGVAKANTEEYVTDFEYEFVFGDGTVELSVERSGGLNNLRYWSDDPEVLDDFDEFVAERVKTVEHQPYLEPYRFKDVDSLEVAELVAAYKDEFVLDGPLPRDSNGQPRMHMQRIMDINKSKDYKHSDEEVESLNPGHKIPGDAKYEVKHLENGDKDVEGEVRIKPQKRDLGLYTVEFSGVNADSQAYLVNTALKAIDPGERDEMPF